MSNLEDRPDELMAACAVTPGVEIMTPRDVPLGGPRAMTVRRTLPQRARSLIGAWCFADHYGPDDVAATGGMRVPPHPHTGLQTVSWLFSGEIEHRDSLGTHSLVHPGELNLMTAGRGISHSEDSTPATRLLHGVQLWTVLPEAHRDAPPAFDHYVPDAVPLTVAGSAGGDAVVRVFLGALAGSVSPVPTFSPLLGAEVLLPAGATLTLEVHGSFEHGLLVDAGQLAVRAGRPGGPDPATAGAVAATELLYLEPGPTSLTLTAGTDDVRLLLLGGPPLGEQIVMWWNFIGRDHADVVAARAQWQREIGRADGPDGGGPGAPSGVAGVRSDGPGAPSDGPEPVRFGLPAGYPGAPLPAPVLPNHRLKPRG